MKRAEKMVKNNRSFDELISKLTGIEILDLNAMSSVRGGEGEGGGDIVLMPPKPPAGGGN
jgi:hypothetical protein